MKTVLVSAAYSDMAKKTISLLKGDCKLILLGRKKELLEELINELSIDKQVVFYADCDVSDEQSCVKAAKLINDEKLSIDGLINFAGAMPVKANISEVSIKDIENELKTRLFGSINLIKSLENIINNNSSIVFINGILSKLPDPNFLCSSISTGAVRSFAKALAKGLVNRGIRVNTINPCASNTKMKDNLFETVADQLGMQATDIESSIVSKIPLNRLCSVEDIANAAKFLLSDNSSFITGTSLDVEGLYNPSL